MLFFNKKIRSFSKLITVDLYSMIFNAWKELCNKHSIILPHRVHKEFQKRIKLTNKGKFKAKLDFSDCKLEDSHVTLLFECLDNFLCIEKLILSKNFLSDKSIVAAVRFLHRQIISQAQCLDDKSSLNEVYLSELSILPSLASINDSMHETVQSLTSILQNYNAKSFIRESCKLFPQELNLKQAQSVLAQIFTSFKPANMSVIMNKRATIPYGELERIALTMLEEDGTLRHYDSSLVQRLMSDPKVLRNRTNTELSVVTDFSSSMGSPIKEISSSIQPSPLSPPPITSTIPLEYMSSTESPLLKIPRKKRYSGDKSTLLAITLRESEKEVISLDSDRSQKSNKYMKIPLFSCQNEETNSQTFENDNSNISSSFLQSQFSYNNHLETNHDEIRNINVEECDKLNLTKPTCADNFMAICDEPSNTNETIENNNFSDLLDKFFVNHHHHLHHKEVFTEESISDNQVYPDHQHQNTNSQCLCDTMKESLLNNLEIVPMNSSEIVSNDSFNQRDETAIVQDFNLIQDSKQTESSIASLILNDVVFIESPETERSVFMYLSEDDRVGESSKVHSNRLGNDEELHVQAHEIIDSENVYTPSKHQILKFRKSIHEERSEPLPYSDSEESEHEDSEEDQGNYHSDFDDKHHADSELIQTNETEICLINLSTEEINTQTLSEMSKVYEMKFEKKFTKGSLANSNISKIDLSQLCSAASLEKLLTLCLQGNSIQLLQSLCLKKVTPNLLNLNLSHNNLTGSIDVDAFPSSLLKLNISNNKISKIDTLCSCPKLLILKGSQNQISQITALPNNLKKLDLSFNQILKPVYIRSVIAFCKDLLSLSLEGNPIWNQNHKDSSSLKIKITSNLQHLLRLDGKMIPSARIRQTVNRKHLSHSINISDSEDDFAEEEPKVSLSKSPSKTNQQAGDISRHMVNQERIKWQDKKRRQLLDNLVKQSRSTCSVRKTSEEMYTISQRLTCANTISKTSHKKDKITFNKNLRQRSKRKEFTIENKTENFSTVPVTPKTAIDLSVGIISSEITNSSNADTISCNNCKELKQYDEQSQASVDINKADMEQSDEKNPPKSLETAIKLISIVERKGENEYASIKERLRARLKKE